MKNYSVFDIVGPNMIGPSSSHTAGAARIGKLASKIAGGEIVDVKFLLHGSFASTYRGHGTDKALVGGILGFSPEDERIKTSFELAKEKGISFEFIATDLGDTAHPNTAKVVMTLKSGEVVEVVGASIGGGNVKINEINGLQLEFTGQYVTLIVEQNDLPGAAAHITKCLAETNVNIAFMRIYRHGKGEIANTIIEADEDINLEVVEMIKSNKALIRNAFVIKM